MNYFIETEAIKALLLGILSCKCPVTTETEKKLFDEFSRKKQSDTVSFTPFMAIADSNPQRTPVHNLFELCACSKDDPLHFTISVNDVLRYLGSLVHYNMVVANNPGITEENPVLLVSHLLLPAELTLAGDDSRAVYKTSCAEITFAPVLVPASLPENSAMYAVHMGMIVAAISKEQAEMIHAQQSLINGFDALTENIHQVDLTSLEPYGDHLAVVRERYRPYSEIV